MKRLGLETDIVDRGVYENTVRRFRDANIVLPTFAELADPEGIPAAVTAALAGVDPDAPDSHNLFRVHWHNDRTRRGRIPPVPLYLARMRRPQRLESPFEVVVEKPGRSARPRQRELSRIDVEVAEPVLSQIELVGDRCRANGDVVAVADVDPGAEGVHGRGAAADVRPGLEHDHVEARSGQIRGADEPVVAGADDGDVPLHAAPTAASRSGRGPRRRGRPRPARRRLDRARP